MASTNIKIPAIVDKEFAVLYALHKPDKEPDEMADLALIYN